MIGRMAQQTFERPPAQPRRGRGATFWVGIALVLAGLAVLGYVAWQFFGTNVVSKHKQQQIVEQTQRAWSSKARATGSAKGVELHGTSALIKIPRVDKKYVIHVQEGVSEDVFA